jgi:ketosteroid isomerase-like protein
VTVDLADRIALHELAARYGDLIDARDWPGLATIFTDDAVFDVTSSGGPVLSGLRHIQQHMDTTDQHPLAHLIVNIYVVDNGEQGEGERVQLHSRVLGILPDRRVGSGHYVDDVVRTDDGWRIRHRQFTLLRRSRPSSAS